MIATLVFCLVTSLTFWSPIAWAAPGPKSPDLDPGQAPLQQAPEPSPKMEDMRISEPPPLAKSKIASTLEESDYFYPFQSAMGPRLGLFLEPERIPSGEGLRYLLGFFYLLPNHSQKKFEVGVDLQSDRTGRVNGYYRYIFNSTGSFRPFVKGGVSCLVESEQGLANFINYKQYALRAGIGLEETFKDPASLRWDLESIIGVKEFALIAVFGYSWAW